MGVAAAAGGSPGAVCGPPFRCAPLQLTRTPTPPQTRLPQPYHRARRPQGVSLAPLVELAVAVSPSLLLLAVGATAAVFCSFSAAALLTQRRSYLFLG